MNRKALSLLSLCQRAGKLISGEESCENALRDGKAYLVITCKDASENTRKKFENKAFYYNRAFRLWFTKDELSHAIGKQNRATVIVSDANLASKIVELIDADSCSES